MSTTFLRHVLLTADIDAAATAYKQLCEGWTFTEKTSGDRTWYMVEDGNGPGGMVAKPLDDEPADVWLTFLKVDDLQAFTDTAKSLDRTLKVIGPRDFGNLGTYSILTFKGQTFGAYQRRRR